MLSSHAAAAAIKGRRASVTRASIKSNGKGQVNGGENNGEKAPLNGKRGGGPNGYGTGDTARNPSGKDEGNPTVGWFGQLLSVMKGTTPPAPVSPDDATAATTLDSSASDLEEQYERPTKRSSDTSFGGAASVVSIETYHSRNQEFLKETENERAEIRERNLEVHVVKVPAPKGDPKEAFFLSTVHSMGSSDISDEDTLASDEELCALAEGDEEEGGNGDGGEQLAQYRASDHDRIMTAERLQVEEEEYRQRISEVERNKSGDKFKDAAVFVTAAIVFGGASAFAVWSSFMV